MSQPHRILLVEDNLPDVVLAQKALSVLANVEVYVAMSAAAALDHLALSHADLLLLDLNLPKVDGFDLLSTMKSSSKMKMIPVVVITSSTTQEDINRAFESGASGYLVKPLSLQLYREMAGTLGTYWFQASKLPTR